MTYVALLRGINVGGRHLLPMKDLRALVRDAGADDVRTYIQSGNVVFGADAELAARLPRIIGDGIRSRFGFDAPLVLRSAAELDAIVAACPYRVEPDDEKLLYVVFLKERPSAARIAALDPSRSPDDRFAAHGGEIYVRYATGVARSKLNNAYFDSVLGTVSTARNWKTTRKLLALARR